MSKSIPHDCLRKGIEVILQNIGTLIDTADLLYRERKYLHSVVFSNSAVEEMAKVQLLIDYHEKGKDVPIGEWTKVSRGGGAHKKKTQEYLSRLIRDYPRERAKIPEMVNEDQLVDLIASFYAKLKERALYVDWAGKSTWRWFPEYYGEDYQKEVSRRLLNVRKRYQNYLERYP